jgi:cell wall-associated NlpC family hydrolase
VKLHVPTRYRILLWFLALALWVSVWLFPLSTMLTRTAGVVLLAVVWLGAIGLSWQRRGVRWTLLGITGLGAAFLASPARSSVSAETLRADYVAALRRYDGVPYFWGGESPRGIDCSGLIRRGLVDGLFLRGVRMLDPGLVRGALSLWWHDTTARALDEQHDGLTVAVTETARLSTFDHGSLLPGDLAVTRNGIHIMVYLGDKVWIEADPQEDRVISEAMPSPRNWFQIPMRIMRWSVLQ